METSHTPSLLSSLSSLPSLHPLSFRRFFIFCYSLYQLAENRPLPRFVSSTRSTLRRRTRKRSRETLRKRSGGRETGGLPGTPCSSVPTSRFAFYITFILLHFSRDKCLRGFASRLGKCFHNVLPCRVPRPFACLIPRFAASLWFLSSLARAEQRNKITPTCVCYVYREELILWLSLSLSPVAAQSK